jgi:hypothetical protein
MAPTKNQWFADGRTLFNFVSPADAGSNTVEGDFLDLVRIRSAPPRQELCPALCVLGG